MIFEQAFQALRDDPEGKIRREVWEPGDYLYVDTLTLWDAGGAMTVKSQVMRRLGVGITTGWNTAASDVFEGDWQIL